MSQITAYEWMDKNNSPYQKKQRAMLLHNSFYFHIFWKRCDRVKVRDGFYFMNLPYLTKAIHAISIFTALHRQNVYSIHVCDWSWYVIYRQIWIVPHSNIEYERKMCRQSALCGRTQMREGCFFRNRLRAFTMVFGIAAWKGFDVVVIVEKRMSLKFYRH